jgi:anti-sigma regulatory factor (Ser/Thr protein kinase)
VAEIDITLTASPEAVGRARHALDGIAGTIPRPLLEDLRLMVSELVTNSVRHAGLDREDPIRLLVAVKERSIRVEVVNPGRGFHAPGIQPTLYQTSGWGLFLVSRLADRWGIDERGGTRVWFEVDRNVAWEPNPAAAVSGPGDRTS